MEPTTTSLDRHDEPGARILIVDDNPSIHRDFELVLLQSGSSAELDAEERQLYGEAEQRAVLTPAYQVDHALSGMEGVSKVVTALDEQRPYQMAFVDIRMPGIDGVETIQRIWKEDPKIQVVICTAYSDYSWEDLIRRLGRTDNLLVLKKPFDSIEVVLLASTLTRKWFMSRQAALKQEEMELLVSRRTQKLMELQQHHPASAAIDSDAPAPGEELPLVLVAETDPKTTSLITSELAACCRVVEVKEGGEALRSAQQMVPDIMVAEIALPGMDGLELCRNLKKGELTSHIPVVLLSSIARAGSQVEVLKAGADQHFLKPLNLPLFKAKIDELLLAGRKARQQASVSLPEPHSLSENQVDQQFFKRIVETVDRHLSDFEFDVEVLAKKVAVSRRQLFRKLKAITGGTPNALIREMRLNRAAQLLRESQMTVTEITYAVGFFDLKHFRTLFCEQFGVLPSEYPRGPGTDQRAKR
jgi:CheY-like chemotaxis protein